MSTVLDHLLNPIYRDYLLNDLRQKNSVTMMMMNHSTHQKHQLYILQKKLIQILNS